MRLSGLKTEILNGATGEVIGPLDPTNGRYPVLLHSPPDAVAAFPAGVKLQAHNLQVLAAQDALARLPGSSWDAQSRKSNPSAHDEHVL